MLLRSALIASLALVMTACAAVQTQRSAGRQLDDFNASLAIKSAMLRADGYVLERIDVEVTEGVVLLTGSAPRPDDRIFAECVAWTAPSVRSVTNTVTVGAGRGTRALANDSWITQQVRARLAGDFEVRSVNYNVETYDGVVHILGFARTEAERERAAQQAASVRGVTRVVDLTRVAGAEPLNAARGVQHAAACDLAGATSAQNFSTPITQPAFDAAPQADGLSPQRAPEPNAASAAPSGLPPEPAVAPSALPRRAPSNDPAASRTWPPAHIETIDPSALPSDATQSSATSG